MDNDTQKKHEELHAKFLSFLGGHGSETPRIWNIPGGTEVVKAALLEHISQMNETHLLDLCRTINFINHKTAYFSNLASEHSVMNTVFEDGQLFADDDIVNIKKRVQRIPSAQLHDFGTRRGATCIEREVVEEMYSHIGGGMGIGTDTYSRDEKNFAMPDKACREIKLTDGMKMNHWTYYRRGQFSPMPVSKAHSLKECIAAMPVRPVDIGSEPGSLPKETLRALDNQVVALTEKVLATTTVTSAPTGMRCSGGCGEYNEYAEPNQANGTHICYRCRQ